MDIKKYKDLIDQRNRLNEEIEKIEEEYFNGKLFYISGYVVDANGDYRNVQHLINTIENKANVVINIKEYKETDILWYDEIDMNRYDCDVETYEAYFEDK